MSKDIVFNQERKEIERNPETIRYNNISVRDTKPWRGNPFSERNPLAKIYDYAFGLRAGGGYIYGLIIQAVFAEGAWRYCVRPEGQDVFWTKNIL